MADFDFFMLDHHATHKSTNHKSFAERKSNMTVAAVEGFDVLLACHHKLLAQSTWDGMIMCNHDIVLTSWWVMWLARQSCDPKSCDLCAQQLAHFTWTRCREWVDTRAHVFFFFFFLLVIFVIVLILSHLDHPPFSSSPPRTSCLPFIFPSPRHLLPLPRTSRDTKAYSFLHPLFLPLLFFSVFVFWIDSLLDDILLPPSNDQASFLFLISNVT